MEKEIFFWQRTNKSKSAFIGSQLIWYIYKNLKPQKAEIQITFAILFICHEIETTMFLKEYIVFIRSFFRVYFVLHENGWKKNFFYAKCYKWKQMLCLILFASFCLFCLFFGLFFLEWEMPLIKIHVQNDACALTFPHDPSIQNENVAEKRNMRNLSRKWMKFNYENHFPNNL